MKKNLIFTTALALAVGLGVAAGAHQAAFVEASAVDDNTVIYLDCSACNWFNDDAKVGLWNHSGNVFNEFTFDSTTNLYKTTVTPGCTSFNLFRGSALNWENIWNQSDDASFEAGKDLIVADAYSDNKLMFHWSKYEEPADRMITPVIDLGSLVSIEGFHYPEVHFYDAAGGTFSVYAPLHQVTGSVYAAHVTYHHSRVIDTVEFLFKEGEEDKFSEPLSFTPINKNAFEFKFNETWDEGDGGKWDVIAPSGHYGVPRLQQASGFGSVSFEVDYEKQMYYATITVTDPSEYIQICYSWWNYGAIREASAFKYCVNYDVNSFKLAAGTYDFFCYNSFEDNGVFEIKKYGDAQETKIYYVTNSADPTVDYIYSWGGTQQFGGFPGTAITSIEGVQELSRNGVVHFQGGDAKLIYQIPVTIGYPIGDEMFMFNNGTSEYKSAERELYPEDAYWWTGDPNNTAGDAIEFINLVETFRHSANDSICEIVQSNAQTLVNCYNGFTKEEQETYIDCTTVYSWTDTTKTSSKLFTYKEVMERLSLIAGIDLSSYGSGERIVTDTTSTVDSNSLIAIVGIIAIISISSIAVLLVVKKIKNN